MINNSFPNDGFYNKCKITENFSIDHIIMEKFLFPEQNIVECSDVGDGDIAVAIHVAGAYILLVAVEKAVIESSEIGGGDNTSMSTSPATPL